MGKKGVRVWVCDECGKRQTWRTGWHWYYGVVSRVNRDENPDFVLPAAFCSAQCGDSFLEKAIAV